MDEIITKLRAPFAFSDIECKVQATTNDKTRGLAVYYADSRAIQKRLDEIVGPMNWRNEYIPWQEKSQLCAISIYDEERKEWVTKCDGAENTDYEPIKGGLSDSFKRAAVMWGLGRYLYDIAGLWVETETRGKGCYIKDGEKPKLREHYEGYVSGGAAPKPNGNPKAKGTVYQFQVKSASPSGTSTCLKLLSPDGNEVTAYVKKGSPGIAVGTLIKNVNMTEQKQNDWTYYLLNKYDVAA